MIKSMVIKFAKVMIEISMEELLKDFGEVIFGVEK